MIPIKDNIPTDRFPFVTLGLIVLNFLAYILAIRHGGSFISGPDLQEVVRYGSIPWALTRNLNEHCELVHGQAILCSAHALPNSLPAWQTAFTAMFMHASILHIGGNMLFLWIFGNNVEDAMGPVKYLAFYILGGSRRRTTSFTERWTFALNGDEKQPWRIVAVDAPVGLA